MSKIVVANWKMNGRLAGNRKLMQAILARLPENVLSVLCVPFPYLAQSGEILSASGLQLGAQDVSAFSDGAYTGQVSAEMLAELGASYVIVGHSERRALCGETDAEVANKAARAQTAGLTPIVCVGESLEERDAGQVAEVVTRQLDALDGKVDMERIVIAYEPVWAIGTGRSATTQQVSEVLSLIRNWIGQHSAQPQDTPVLYGGSVKVDNASELFALAECDGGLIGGASLIADDFIAICTAAAAMEINKLSEGA